MFENRKESKTDLPDPEWMGRSTKDLYYIDEVIAAISGYQPSFANSAAFQRSSEVVSLLNELRLQPTELVPTLLKNFESAEIEIAETTYQIKEVIGLGEDGIVLKAADGDHSVAIKFSWPFNPHVEQQSEQDSITKNSALLEREALMQLTHRERILSLSSNYIIPDLIAHDFVPASKHKQPSCSSVIVMEYIECSSFDEFVDSIASHPDGLSDFIEVSIGAIRANLMMHELGYNDDGEAYGIYRLDNGIRNLAVHYSDGPQSHTSVTFDFGNVGVPEFTGMVASEGISISDKLSALASSSLRALSTSLADTLTNSNLEHPLKADVVSALQNTSDSKLIEQLEQLRQDAADHSSSEGPQETDLLSFEKAAFNRNNAA